MIPVSHPTRRDNLAVVFGSAGRSANHLTDHSSLESLVPSPPGTLPVARVTLARDPSTMGLLQTPRQKASKGDPPIVPCWKPECVQQAGFLHHRQCLSPRHYDSRNLLTGNARDLPLRLVISKDRGSPFPGLSPSLFRQVTLSFSVLLPIINGLAGTGSAVPYNDWSTPKLRHFTWADGVLTSLKELRYGPGKRSSSISRRVCETPWQKRFVARPPISLLSLRSWVPHP